MSIFFFFLIIIPNYELNWNLNLYWSSKNPTTKKVKQTSFKIIPNYEEKKLILCQKVKSYETFNFKKKYQNIDCCLFSKAKAKFRLNFQFRWDWDYGWIDGSYWKWPKVLSGEAWERIGGHFSRRGNPPYHRTPLQPVPIRVISNQSKNYFETLSIIRQSRIFVISPL